MRYALVLMVGCAAHHNAAGPQPRPVAWSSLPVVPDEAQAMEAGAVEAPAVEGQVVEPMPIAAPPSAPEETTIRSPTALGGGLITTGATTHRAVLFTFDDGPHPLYTPQVLDVLDAAGVRAIFFVVPGRIARGGARGEEEAALVREIARRGHVVGSHGLNHVHLHRLTADALRLEVVGAEETLRAVLGERPLLFRPPGGARSMASDALLDERGYTQMLWTVVTGDFLTEDPDAVVATFRRSLRGHERRGMPGGAVLLHDTHPWTLEALPHLLSYLSERNCELAAQGEELYDPSPDPRWFITPRGAGDAPDQMAPAMQIPPAVLEARQAALREAARSRCPAD